MHGASSQHLIIAWGCTAGRPKNLYSVHSKLRRKTGAAGAAAGGPGLDVSQIYDVRALRLVVDSKQDCYEALRAVETLWTPVPSRFKVGPHLDQQLQLSLTSTALKQPCVVRQCSCTPAVDCGGKHIPVCWPSASCPAVTSRRLPLSQDYIRNPKANGYQSLHTVVTGPDGLPIEVRRLIHLESAFLLLLGVRDAFLHGCLLTNDKGCHMFMLWLHNNVWQRLSRLFKCCAAVLGLTNF